MTNILQKRYENVKKIYVHLTPEIEEGIKKIKEKGNYQSEEEVYQYLLRIGLDKAREEAKEGHASIG